MRNLDLGHQDVHPNGKIRHLSKAIRKWLYRGEEP